jgi:hypothetical protein
MSNASQILEVEPNKVIYALVNATVGGATVWFIDNGDGYNAIGESVLISYATDNKWPGAAGVNADGMVTHGMSSLQLGNAVYHLRFENTGSKLQTLKITIDMPDGVQPTQGPASDGYNLGGDDALAIILSLAVVIVIFAVVSVVSTRLDPETGALLLR